MLETFSLAPEVSAFDLGCLNHATGRMSFRKTWTAPEVRRALGWLAARNATGSSCYIRPAADLGRTSWVLAGSLTAEAWLRLAVPADLDTRTAVARFFTRKAGGDPGAVRGAQLGHLPGTTNRAPASAGRRPGVLRGAALEVAVGGQGADRPRAPVDVVQRAGVQGRARRCLRPSCGQPLLLDGIAAADSTSESWTKPAG